MSTKPELWSKIPFGLCTFLYVGKKKKIYMYIKKNIAINGESANICRFCYSEKNVKHIYKYIQFFAFIVIKHKHIWLDLFYCKQIPIN